MFYTSDVLGKVDCYCTMTGRRARDVVGMKGEVTFL